MRMNNIHSSVYSMNTVEDPVDGSTLIKFNSLADTPPDIRECVANSARVTGITLDVFDSMGADFD